jgi:hypothetical protein
MAILEKHWGLQILCSSQITLFLMFATMESEGSSLDHDVMEILIKGHTHREVDELMLVNNNDCTDMPALVEISDQEVEEGVDDYTDLPALVAISDDEVEIRPDGMDQEKSVDKEFRLHRGATWTGK